MVQGQRVKGQGHTAYVTANTDSLQMSRFVTYLPCECVQHPCMRIALSGRIGSTWPLPGALRKTSENNIFKPNKPEKIPERLARYRSAVEMQCFRNCTLSSLLLTRGVASRDLHLWLPRGTSQNAIFSNKKPRKC